MSKKLSDTEKAFGRSAGYYDLSPEDQWAEDKRNGILDWDGSENDTQTLLVKLAPAKWCSCANWKAEWRTLANHDQMNFCIFCGKKLVKE